MNKTRIIKLLCCSLSAICLLSGCKKDSLNCDFTEINWENSLEEIFAYEGGEYGSYPSLYEGTTYTFPKEFVGQSGTIKYMTDKDDKLMNVAWTYQGVAAEDTLDVYNKVYEVIYKENGQPTKNSNGVNNYGEVWRLKEGNIILSAVVTSDSNLVQVAYLNPLVSTGNDANPSTSPTP